MPCFELYFSLRCCCFSQKYEVNQRMMILIRVAWDHHLCTAWGHLNFIILLSYTNYWSNYESYFTSHHVSGTYMRKWYLNLFICMKKVVTKGNLSDYEESSRPTALSRLCITCWMIFEIFHCSHQEPIFLLSFVSISRIPHCIYLLAVIAKWLTVLKFSWEDSPEMK